MDYIITNGELCHYGVKGMKWGVRRTKKAVAKYANMAKRQSDVNFKVAKEAKKMLDSGYNHNTKTRLHDNDRQQINDEYKRFSAAGEEWLKTRSDILSMDVNAFTAGDVKRRYKNTKAGGWYVY